MSEIPNEINFSSANAPDQVKESARDEILTKTSCNLTEKEQDSVETNNCQIVMLWKPSSENMDTPISTNECRILMLWKDPMQFHVILQFPVKVWRYEEELQISPAFEAHDIVKLYIGLYKLRPQAIEDKSKFFNEMIKLIWRIKRRYLTFQSF